MPTNEELDLRLKVLERQDTLYQLTIANLEKADSTTAAAVDRLAFAINDPKLGLIVELDRFRTEVKTDRRITMAFLGGLVVVVNLVVPYVPSLIKTITGP